MHLLRTFKKVLLGPHLGPVQVNPLQHMSPRMTSVSREVQHRSWFFMLRRHYCDGRQLDAQPKVKTLYIPNPFVLLKNKWLTYRIQKEIDTDFSLDEFVNGASYVSLYIGNIIIRVNSCRAYSCENKC